MTFKIYLNTHTHTHNTHTHNNTAQNMASSSVSFSTDTAPQPSDGQSNRLYRNVLVMGPPQSGKTTFVDALMGGLMPHSGDASIAVGEEFRTGFVETHLPFDTTGISSSSPTVLCTNIAEMNTTKDSLAMLRTFSEWWQVVDAVASTKHLAVKINLAPTKGDNNSNSNSNNNNNNNNNNSNNNDKAMTTESVTWPHRVYFVLSKEQLGAREAVFAEGLLTEFAALLPITTLVITHCNNSSSSSSDEAVAMTQALRSSPLACLFEAVNGRVILANLADAPARLHREKKTNRQINDTQQVASAALESAAPAHSFATSFAAVATALRSRDDNGAGGDDAATTAAAAAAPAGAAGAAGTAEAAAAAAATKTANTGLAQFRQTLLKDLASATEPVAFNWDLIRQRLVEEKEHRAHMNAVKAAAITALIFTGAILAVHFFNKSK